jgi:hypothetical protein
MNPAGKVLGIPVSQGSARRGRQQEVICYQIYQKHWSVITTD